MLSMTLYDFRLALLQVERRSTAIHGDAETGPLTAGSGGHDRTKQIGVT